MCWQWKKNLPGIREGRRPGLEMASLWQNCDPSVLLLPVTGQTWQCHLAACHGDTALLTGWHVPMGSHETAGLRGDQHRALWPLTQTLRAASHTNLPAGPTFKGRLLQQCWVIGPQEQAAPPDCAMSTRSSSLHHVLPHVLSEDVTPCHGGVTGTKEVPGTGPAPGILSWALCAVSWGSSWVFAPRLKLHLRLCPWAAGPGL